MEPDVIRMYSSSPPPMEDSVEDEDEEFGDFDTFSGVPSSISLTEFDTPTTFNQSQALSATSPPELLHSRGLLGFSHSSSNGTHTPDNESDGVTPASQQDGCPSERTEMKKILSGCAVSDTASGKPVDCNGGGTEVLTNGFATFDVQESPSSVKPVHSDVDKDSLPVCSTVDSFADFAAFSGAEGHHNHNRNHNHNQTASMDRSTGGSHHCMTDQGLSSEDTVRDTNRTQSNTSSSDSRSGLSEASACENGTDSESLQRFAAGAEEHSASETVCMDSVLTQNGLDVCNETALSPDAAADSEAEQSDGKVSGNETETETETSFGQPLSTDALEEYGEVSTTGSAPSPPLQGDASTPADHSQLAEDEDEEDFGDFGDAGSFCGQGFAGFEQPEDVSATEDDDFGDFNTPRFISSGCEEQDRGRVAEFPVSESFGNFSSAVEGGEGDVGWSAFGDQQQVEGEAWAAFSTEEGGVPHAESRVEEVEEEMEEWHESEASAVSEETDRELMLLSSRLQKLFQMSFPQTSTVTSTEDQVVSLKALLEPGEDKTQPGAEEGTRSPSCHRSAHGDVWTQLQDIHDALGLRYQWGGSHCNKVLLCCLGIDTRNILFTGQKKQPVIVPMYAANLGMLEPTKEPVKPVSAAEMIASIAQTLPPDNSSCPSDSVQQEALPPIQFDWSSSGLTNPLDASGGSSLLNLDFFGPVEDSGSSSSTSIPGVDPELYELTTAKLDPGSSGSRVADAFARLMSTMEKTSTSTRKPRKDENLSEEAAKVIAGLPDLTFMQAKVLMFPATLTPLDSQAASD